MGKDDKLDKVHKKIEDLEKLMESLKLAGQAKNEEKKADIPEEMNCVICQELMTVPTAAIPCMHTFCKNCIDQWMTK